MSDSIELAIVGGGHLGEALLSGLSAGGPVVPERIAVVELDADRAVRLRDRFGVSIVDIERAVCDADVLLLAVKPHHVAAVLARVVTSIPATGQLIVSAAGGITTHGIETALGGTPAVVRCMPNVAIAAGHGMTAISAGRHADDRHLARVRALFESVGRVVEVPEYQLDAVTALSGSGPAYFSLVAEALVDAGVLLGLPRPLAQELVTQTALGAGVLLREPDADAARIRATVSSPGGTTIAAVRELENRAFRAALMAAAEAARDRSVWLGERESAVSATRNRT